jgi:hypothetical protein
LIARSTEGRVIVKQLPAGESSYLLTLSEKSASSERLSTLGTGSKEDWERGVAVRFDAKGSQFELVRQAVIAKNVEYFNRYRPQNETYLFGFRKYEQGQNAAEMSQFERQVAEAEARIASLRKPRKVEFILSSFARRSILDKNR